MVFRPTMIAQRATAMKDVSSGGGSGKRGKANTGAEGAPPSDNRIIQRTWRVEGRWVDRRTISAVWLDGVHECSDNQHVKKASSTTTTCRGIVGLPI